MHRHGRHCEEVDARLAGPCGQEHRRGRGGCGPPAAMSRAQCSFLPMGNALPSGTPEKHAKAICGGCPVIGQCAAYAIQYANGTAFGVGCRSGTRRSGARTWPGAGGRMDKQRRPEQRGKRDPVTLPRPDLPIVPLSHHGPVSFGRDESGRTANRGAGGLVTALIGAIVGPPRRRLGMRAATDEDPLSLASTTTSVQHQPGARAAAPRPGRARLSGAPGSHRSAAPGRGRPPGPRLLRRGPSRAGGTRAPHGAGTESPP